MSRTKFLFLGLFALLANGTLFAQYPDHEMYVGKTTQEFASSYGRWNYTNPVLYTDCQDDEEFFISRVRLKDRFVNTETQVDPELDYNRKLLWWCPIGVDQWNALPTYHYDSEVFSMWSYVDIYGNWTAPFIRMPAAFIDACHKNGVRTSVVASVPWSAQISTTQKPHGENIHALYTGGTEKLLKFLRYYGIDGIGFNSEFNADGTITSELKSILSNAFAQRKQYNWPSFTNAWYSLMGNGGSIGGTDWLSSYNQDWFQYNGNPTSDAYFFNYNWGADGLATAQQTAEGLGRDSYDCYAGMDFQGRSSTNWLDLKNYKISVGLWGAHSMNMLFTDRAELGSTDKVKQSTYQLISENVFTGSSYNPVNTPAISNFLGHSSKNTNFHGFSSFITARSVLKTDDLSKEPFVTYFNLGNGTFFNVKGERKFEGEWYNIGIQDYLPTWRWWWTSTFMGREELDVPTTGMKAEFTWDDAWFGGSCLAISGQTEQEYLQLFKTEYPLQANDEVTIRYKVLSGTGTMAWSYCAKGRESEALSTNIGSLEANDEVWVEKTIKVSNLPIHIQMAGKTLAMLGLRFQNTSSDFEVLIGEISIRRGTTPTPATPTIVKTQSLGANYKGVDFKVIFKMKDRNGVEPIYNDEVNAWYYKIYYQQQGGEPVMCTATTSWGAYVVGAPIDQSGTMQYRIGVSAVSIDGESESAIAWSNYVAIPNLTVIEGISIDKPVIKPNEDFTISFDDPNHAPTTWTILRAGETIKSQNGTSWTTSLPEIGIYDLKYTSNEETVTREGLIQISPEEVGAMPEIKELKANNKTSDIEVYTGDEVTYTYVGRNADGYVSRGLMLGEKAFGIPCDQLEFGNQSPFTICFWMYVNRFNHLGVGTQLLNIRSAQDSYPASQWGYIWNDIKTNNEILFAFRQSGNAGTQTIIQKVLAPEQWYHIAFVIGYNAGRTMDMYINGEKVGTTLRATDLYAWSNNNIIMLGGIAGGNNDMRAGLDATIDEFQLYNKALSASEVKASMQHIDAPSTNLIGYWDFETDPNEDGYLYSTGSDKSLKATMMNFQGAGSGESSGKYESLPEYFGAGAPFISGTNYKVETLPTWKFHKTATINSATGNTTTGTAKVEYSEAGTYTATLTLSNGWGSSESKSIDVVVIKQTTGVDEVSAVDTRVYPNPFVDELYVNFAEKGAYTIQVFDLAGSLVSSHAVDATGGEVIRVSVNATPGSYIVRMSNAEGKTVKTLKLIKQ